MPLLSLGMEAVDYVVARTPVLTDAALRGSVVLLAAFAVTACMRRTSAAARHVVWVSSVMIVLVTPLLGYFAPRWDAHVLPANFRFVAFHATAPSAVRLSTSLPPPAPEGPLPPGSLRRTIAEAPLPPMIRISTVDKQDVPPHPWQSANWFALIWIVGAIMVIMRLGIGTTVVWRTARRSMRVTDPGWLSLVNRMALELGISRPVTLLMSAGQVVPVTWGIVYPVVLLPVAASDWNEERREAVLVHELAHVGRFDALTQMVMQIALALFWFNPLMWIAAKRVRTERERACDDLVLSQGTRASAYADDLLSMVRVLTRNTEPAFAALAMARRSEIEGRMLAILDPRIDRRRLGHRGVALALVTSLAIALPLAAFRPLPRRSAQRQISLVMMSHADDQGAGCANGSGHQIWINSGHSKGDESTFSSSNGKRCLVVHTTGKVTYGDDDAHVESIAAGGHISITETADGVEHEYEAAPGPHGLDETFYVNGKRVDAAVGREWLRTAILQVVRQNAELAPARVARIRKQSGVAGVLTEVNAITGDYGKRAYLDALLSGPGMTPDSLHVITGTGARELTSDYDRAEFLDRVAKLSRDQATIQQVAAAAGGMSSDYYRAKLLTSALANGGNDAVARNVLSATADIRSDYYRASLLLGVLSRDHLGDDMLTSVIKSTNDMQSDYYRATVLDSLARRQSLASSRVYTALLRSADGITGSYGRAAVLQAVLQRRDLTPDLAVAAIDDAATLTSGVDKGGLLDIVAGTPLMKNAAVHDAFLRTAKTITSAIEYRRAVSAVSP